MSELIERLEEIQYLWHNGQPINDNVKYIWEAITALREQEASQGISQAGLSTIIAEQQARIEQYEQLIAKVREGTWWDGNEPWNFSRLESWVQAEYARIRDENID